MKVNEAKLAIKNGNYKEAILLLSELIQADNKNFEFYALRGVAHRKLNDFKLSLEDFNAAIKLTPNNADLRTEKGVTLFHQKSIDLALVEMNLAVKLEPNNPYRYSSRAYIKDALKDIDGAILDYKKTIELDPNDAVAHNNLGLLEEKKGNLEKAKKHFDQSDDLQGIDMKKITDDAVKNGGSSIPKTEAKKEVVELRKQEEVKIKESELSTWKIISQVFTKKEVLKEFLGYLKALFSKRK